MDLDLLIGREKKHGLVQKGGQSCMRHGLGKSLVAGKDELSTGHPKTAQYINLKSTITFTSLPDRYTSICAQTCMDPHIHTDT